MSWFLILLVVVAGYLLLRPLGVQEWDTTSYPVPDGDHDIGVAQAEIQAGLEAIRTDYYGTTDPSTGASWGADQLGTTCLQQARSASLRLAAGHADRAASLRLTPLIPLSSSS